jgi:hypothetical protein
VPLAIRLEESGSADRVGPSTRAGILRPKHAAGLVRLELQVSAASSLSGAPSLLVVVRPSEKVVCEQADQLIEAA